MDKKSLSKKTKWSIVLISLGLIVIVASLSSEGTSKEQIKNMSAIQQMAIAFDGGYSEEEIKSKITEAMILYNVPITEENYSRAGSTLVALRQQQGIEEMLILDYMINKLYTPSVKLSFSEAAGFSVTILKTGAN